MFLQIVEGEVPDSTIWSLLLFSHFVGILCYHGIYKNGKIKIPDIFQTFFLFSSVKMGTEM